jgi:hypothetical protein
MEDIIMALSGSYKVASNAAVRAYAGKANEMLIRGLQSISLPVGFTMSTLTVSSMGERIDQVLPAGGSYEEISVNYNFVIGDPSQTYLMQASLNNTEIQDMRFYVDDNQLCGDFAAPDLISDAGASYRVGTFSSPTGSKNELFTGTVSFLPAGASTLFIAHANGTDLDFAAGTGATITSTTQDFEALGFEAGQTIIFDHVESLDPLWCKILTVGTNLITLVDGTGDEADVTTFTGIATTSIHAGTPMTVAGASALSC